MLKKQPFELLTYFYVVSAVTIILGFMLLTTCCSASSTETVKAEQNSTVEKAETSEKKVIDHSVYEALLKLYVDDNGKVDYDAFTKDKAKLDEYLASLAEIDFASLASDDERNALHINAYNAFTLSAVISDVYGKNSSVKNIKGFWDTQKHRLAKRDLTLDEIEKYSRNLDPRVHFAYNCASASCPKLQRFAYTGAKLQEQLESATQDFLADPVRGVNIDQQSKKIKISRLFSWYASDFKGNTGKFSQYVEIVKSKFSAGVGVAFIKSKVGEDVKKSFEDKSYDVSFLDYSWELNSVIPPGDNLPKAPINE
jgi:Protein of unknown function, DUF547